MYRQWIRTYSVLIGQGGKGIVIKPPLNINFETTKTIIDLPNLTNIKIYNLNKEHRDAIKEYNPDNPGDIIIQAGYVQNGGEGILFTGKIKWAFTYPSGADKISELICFSGEDIFRNSYVNKTFAPGSTPDDILNYQKQSLGVQNGVQPQNIKGNIGVRGDVQFGAARDSLTNLTRNMNSTWSIQDGKFHVVPRDFRNGTGKVFKIDVNSGLIKPPELSDVGLEVTINMDPRITIDSILEINADYIKPKNTPDISQGAYAGSTQSIVTQGGTNTQGLPNGPIARRLPFAPIAKNGQYRVIQVSHSGEYREGEWITKVIAIANGTEPIRKVPIEAVYGLQGNSNNGTAP